jgi:hypothetical protein
MALTTTQKYTSGEEVGRNLWFKTLSHGTPGLISQTQFNAAVKHIQLTASVEVIGAYDPAASIKVLFVISGADIPAQAAAAFGGMPDATWADLPGWDAVITA